MGTISYAITSTDRLSLTEDDAIWLGRSLAGETSATESGRAAAAWTMLTRTLWLRKTGHATTAGMPCSRAPTGRGIPELEPVIRPMDFTSGIRCFSSPTNPYHTDRVPERAARRRMLIVATWAKLEQLSPGVKDFVYRFLRGQVRNPVPGAADFDAPGEEPSGARIIARIGGNLFMGEPGAPADVRITAAPVTASLFGGSWLVWLGVGAAVTAVALYLKARKARTGNRPVRKRNSAYDVEHTAYDFEGRLVYVVGTLRLQQRVRSRGYYNAVSLRAVDGSHLPRVVVPAGEFNKRATVVGTYNRVTGELQRMAKNPAPPEYASVEAFVEYLIEDERDEFTAEELGDLAYHLRTSRNKLRRELEGYGLRLAGRAFEKRVRGVTADPHDRWYGLGSSPTSGGSGWEQISGFAGKANR